MKMRLMGLLAIAVLLSMSAYAEKDTDRGRDIPAIDDLMVKAFPEVLDEQVSQAATLTLSAMGMKCFVDTSAYDYFTYDQCFGVGTALYTSAVFKIDGAASGSIYIWSDSRCSRTSSYCTIPIRQYQTITLSAYVLQPDYTWQSVQATARYEGLW